MVEISPLSGSSGPRYLDAVERLSGVPFFPDEKRALAIRSNPGELSPQDLQERTLLYRAGLRILAERRRYGESPDQEARAMFIGQQMLLIHNVEAYGPRAPRHLRPHQRPVTNFVAKMMLSRPEKHQLTEVARNGHSAEELFTKGGIFVSATGTGKTVQERAVFTQLGIDSEENMRRTTPLWGLVIVSSQDAVNQFTGLAGDDTFRRFGPEVPITPFFQNIQDNSGLIVVTTKQMFVQKFRNNAFDGRPMPAVIVVDEAHRVTEPEVYKTLQEHWRGPVFGFTATPTYRPGKDAEKILPYVLRRGNLISDIRDGILNGAQLFTFLVDPRHNESLASLDLERQTIYEKAGKLLLDRAVVDFAVNRVNAGRQGIIYCERGDRSDHAQQLAEQISNGNVTLPDGTKRPIIAKAVGLFQSHKVNDSIINDYHAGKVDVLTSVEKIIESFNADVDFVAFAVRTTSLLRLRQMIGRGTRPSEAFPVTEYAEFIVPELLGGDNYVSLWDGFGLSEIEQGKVIKAQRRGKKHRKGSLDASEEMAQELAVLQASELPEHLQEYCGYASSKPLSELTIRAGAREMPLEGHIPLHAILAATGRSERRVRQELKYYPRSGAWEYNAEGEEVFVPYYSPEALHDLLVKRQVASKSRHGELLTPHTIATLLGIPDSFVRNCIRIGQAQGLEGFAGIQLTQVTVGYGPAVQEYAKKRFLEIPPPQFGEITVDDLSVELGVGRQFVEVELLENNMSTLPRRLPNNLIGAYLAHKDAELLRRDFYSTPLAEADELGIQEVFAFARVGSSNYRILDTEQSLLAPKRQIEKPGRILNIFKPEDAMQVIKRLLPTTMPAYLISQNALVKMTDHPENSVVRFLKKQFQPVSLHLPGTGGTSVLGYPWAALEVLEKEFGLKEGFASINYKDLPRSPQEVTPETYAAARSLQGRCMPSVHLREMPLLEEVKEEIRAFVEKREKMRESYLSQYDRAERWYSAAQGIAYIPSTPLPTPPTSVAKTKQGSLPSGLEQTAAEIAAASDQPLAVVEEAIASLSAEYQSALTVGERQENGRVFTTYKGKYRDAILMTLVGRTSERIAEIAGMPHGAVDTYLRQHFTPNDKGRYGLKAMIATLAEFRRAPSRNYVLLREAVESIDRPEEEIVNIIRSQGGKIDYFYNLDGEKEPYVSYFSRDLARILLTKDPTTVPPATGRWCNRYEIKELKKDLTFADIDKYLARPEAMQHIAWLRVRDSSRAHGAPILPHYPWACVRKLLDDHSRNTRS